jgi:hypothetical protein
MICLFTDDESYYRDSESLKKKYKLKELLVMPTVDEIKQKILSGKDVGVLTPIVYPKEIFGDLLVYKELNPTCGALTIQEQENKITEYESLSQKLHLDVYDYNTLPTLEEMAGANGFLEWVKKITNFHNKGKRLKPSIFVGMAGCGKSRGVEALANHWKVPLIDLKLQKILEHDKPYQLIDRIFKYLHRTQLKCVVRMDEIEQMLEDKGMLGNLLTLFNNLNTRKGYQINGKIIATANNIDEIVKVAPQFFRHGRWNEKFFVGFPDDKNALKIMELYTKIYGVNFGFKIKCDKMSLEDTLFEVKNKISTKYKGNIAKNEGGFVYAPSEIDYLFERLGMYESVGIEELERELEIVVPLQETANEGVNKMYTEAKRLAFKDINKL